jgi:hypothetical protein
MDVPFKINPQVRWYLGESAKMLASGKKVKGWRRFNSKSRKLNAFYNSSLGVVLKKPVFIMDHRTPLALRAPTVYLKDDWVVQPILKRNDLNEALAIIQGQLVPHLARGIFPDIHRGNIGWLGKQPLMFDW